jgi:hypothetical protein
MKELDRELDRLAAQLPGWAAKTIHWVRKPGSGWVRYPLALLLIAGGFVGFLPILGFWMIPLGLLVLSIDIPRVRRWRRRFAVWFHRRFPRLAAKLNPGGPGNGAAAGQRDLLGPGRPEQS